MKKKSLLTNLQIIIGLIIIVYVIGIVGSCDQNRISIYDALYKLIWTIPMGLSIYIIDIVKKHK